MNDSISSLDELVALIGEAVSKRFAATGRSTNGTYLADAIKARDPAFRYEHLGLTRLGDAVRIAETRGLVHRDSSVKHLEVSPGAKPSVAAESTWKPTYHVSADIWRAFVFFRSEDERVFFDIATRRVLTEAECDFGAGGDSLTRYLEIKPIASATQQAWMREFIESHSSLEVESAPLSDPRWWSAVPQWLRQQGSEIERSWNRFRTTQVAEYLRVWAEDHKLEPQFFISHSPGRDDAVRGFNQSDDEALRKALSDAVRELPLDVLGEIVIPVRIIRRYLRTLTARSARKEGMSKITLIGGLDDCPRRDELIAALNQLGGDLEWDYVDAERGEQFIPKKSRLNSLLEQIIAAAKTDELHRVAKLYQLHAGVQARLYRVCPDPILVPKEITTSEDLLAWVQGPEANLIPQREWFVNLKEAALIAILCKLIRKKSWNKDTKGHQWTLEEHLLHESPVLRPNFQPIHNEAVRLLSSLRNDLLLSKGANQGNTPKEWCIRIELLSAVMRSMLARNLTPLQDVVGIRPLMRQICADADRRYRIDESVLSEKILDTCRMHHRT